MKEPRIPVAREGYPFIAFAAFTTLVFALLGHQSIAILSLFVTGFVFYFELPGQCLPGYFIDILANPLLEMPGRQDTDTIQVFH